ncbi:6-pyruvoyl tetrahydrobiopterin synthase [Achromatium sp. WMS2]|nr:6-pyruvoyl tetrahydrobiopterin synthase [Achromatium sp. WMS2]
MYNIRKEIHFCYGHRLLNHTGPCRYLHGHNAIALICLNSEELDKLGMVCDFSELGHFAKAWVDRELDHQLLLHQDDPLIPWLQQAGERHRVLACNPTAENIAKLIFEALAAAKFSVSEVTVYETPTASASYSHATAYGQTR